MRELRCAACKDLNVAAVLSSSGAVGSITPAAREDGKDEKGRRRFDLSALNEERSVVKRGH